MNTDTTTTTPTAPLAHTPGPWHVVNGIEVHDKAAEYDSSGTRIGETPNRICLVEYPYSYPDYRHGATKEANARLIAAAPELLEALRGALVALEQAYTALPDDSPAQDYFVACYIEPAREAIARATGEGC